MIWLVVLIANPVDEVPSIAGYAANYCSCQKERGFRGPGFWSAKLTECLALPERQSASAMVLTKPNPTMWSIKKEVLAEARTTGQAIESLCCNPHYFHRIQGAVFLTALLAETAL
jgi:hypothetical protein